jgi:chemotaxis protein methyltransferase CheR
MVRSISRSAYSHENKVQHVPMYFPQFSGSAPESRPEDSNFGAADYMHFQQEVQTHFNLRLGDYRIDQMQRRLRTFAESHGCASFTLLLQQMRASAVLRDTVLGTMTINVTELLRNPERFEELRRDVLPDLLAARRNGVFKVWSAGCSYGAEAMTLALLLQETAPSVRHEILATDIDRTVLEKAKTVCFTGQDMTHVSLVRRDAHFLEHGPDLPRLGTLTPRFQPLPHLRSKVAYTRHDLLAGPFPDQVYDLVVCRNVLIYFTEPAKERIYRGFSQSLRPGGILFVGGTERVPDHRRFGFELLRPFFYRKLPLS